MQKHTKQVSPSYIRAVMFLFALPGASTTGNSAGSIPDPAQLIKNVKRCRGLLR
jgi:hypothetical protein